MNNSIIVSICCTAYNHAPYIRQCLDGFIMQKTNFPIEVIIHDDASTDGTTDIIKEYEQIYPQIIKPIYQTENQYSKKINIYSTYIFLEIKGKYIAFCEGDDYWIDEYKLQKQVDFMEANGDFSICFHNVKVYDENINKFTNNFQVSDVPEITCIKDLAVGNYIHTPSVMYRYNNDVISDLKKLPSLVIGDYIYHMLFAKCGKIKKIQENMAVYRVHKGSTWSLKPIEYKLKNWLKVLSILIYYYRDELEICAILVEQYKNYSIQLYPSIHKDFFLSKYNDLINSKSWRYTEPFRKLSSLLKMILLLLLKKLKKVYNICI